MLFVTHRFDLTGGETHSEGRNWLRWGHCTTGRCVYTDGLPHYDGPALPDPRPSPMRVRARFRGNQFILVSTCLNLCHNHQQALKGRITQAFIAERNNRDAGSCSRGAHSSLNKAPAGSWVLQRLDIHQARRVSVPCRLGGLSPRCMSDHKYESRSLHCHFRLSRKKDLTRSLLGLNQRRLEIHRA